MIVRNITLVLLLINFIPVITAQNEYNDKAFTSSLNGKVKAVLMTVELFGEESIQTTSDMYKIDNYYDSTGIRTQRILLNADNVTVGSSVYHKDKAGNVTDIYYNDQYGNLVSRIQYLYTPHNQWAEVRYFRGGFELREKLTYDYDSTGKLQSITKSGPTDNPVEYQLFYYNANGQDTLSVFLDRKKRIIKKARYEYDPENRLTSYRQYNTDGDLIESYSATFSSQGNIKGSETRYISPGSVKITTDIYDSYGNPLVETEQMESLENTTIVSRFTYTYDALHNWTTKHVTRNGKPAVTGTRRIEYYDSQK